MPKTHDQIPSLVSQHVKTYGLQLPWPKVLGNHAVKHTRAGQHYKVPAAQAYDALVAQILAGMGLGRLSRQKPLTCPLCAVLSMVESRHEQVGRSWPNRVPAACVSAAALSAEKNGARSASQGLLHHPHQERKLTAKRPDLSPS